MPSSGPEAQHPSPFVSRVFRETWTANVISNMGSLIQLVGASWMMTTLTSSQQMVALIQASTALPLMLMAPFAGAVADSIDRRRVMLAAQSFAVIASTGLAVLAWTGMLTPWLLLCFTFLIGCGVAMKIPAWQAAVGEIVPRGALPGAIALNSMGFNIARSVGPAIGGAIVAVVGPAAAFIANAAGNLGMVAALLRWRPQRAGRSLPSERLFPALGTGVRYAMMSPPVLVVLPRAAAFGFAAIGVQALLPLMARDVMHGGAITYGFLLGAFGVGAVGGATLITRLRGRWPAERIVRTSSVALAIATLGLGLSPALALTALALAIIGAGWVTTLSTFNVSVQLSTPNWVLARVLALYQMAAFGGIAAGSWVAGLLAERFGVTDALLMVAALQAATVLLTLRLPLSVIEDLNLSPFRNGRPETDLPLAPQTGPIVVTIEFRIRSSDTEAFHALMVERRRIRRRNGARSWELLRDVADPELWTERYQVSSWLDYERHQERLVQHEAQLFTRIRALHIGPEPPRVRRLVVQSGAHAEVPRSDYTDV